MVYTYLNENYSVKLFSFLYFLYIFFIFLKTNIFVIFLICQNVTAFLMETKMNKKEKLS